MRVGDVVDELLVGVGHPQSKVNWGAINAFNALWDQHAPDCIGPGGDAGKQIPPEAIDLVRASLLAAIAALDSARAKHPTEPRGLLS